MALYLGSNQVAPTYIKEGTSGWIDVSSHFTFDTSYITVQEVHAVSNNATISNGSIIYFNATITVSSYYSGLDNGFLQTDFDMGNSQPMMVSGYDSSQDSWIFDYAVVDSVTTEFGSVSTIVEGSDIYLNATIICVE